MCITVGDHVYNSQGMIPWGNTFMALANMLGNIFVNIFANLMVNKKKERVLPNNNVESYWTYKYMNL